MKMFQILLFSIMILLFTACSSYSTNGGSSNTTNNKDNTNVTNNIAEAEEDKYKFGVVLMINDRILENSNGRCERCSRRPWS